MGNKLNADKKRVLFTAKPSLRVKRTKFAAAASSAGAADGEQITLEGYCVVWGVLSSDRGGFQVRFLPGSAHFADPSFALFHHDYRAILGSTSNQTLRLASDAFGVKVEIDLPGTTTAADVAILVDRGDIGGMSFSMLYDDVLVTTDKTENGVDVCEVSAFTMDECTVTAIPSFVQTSIAVQEQDDDTATPGTAELSKVTAAAPERIAQSIKLQQSVLAAKILDD